MPTATVLISDITGSTRLYEREGSARTMALIQSVLSRIREIVVAAGGEPVKSKGDDVLSLFEDPDHGASAAWDLLNEPWPGDLGLHSGLYRGDLVQQGDEVFGNAVNTAARLASMAKPGEALFGGEGHADLSPENRGRFVLIGDLQLRGKEAPTRVHAASVGTLSAQTLIGARGGQMRASRTEAVRVTLGDRTWHVAEGETLLLGRATDCDVVFDQAWVSRKHAVLSLRSSILEFTDHSSTGSVIRTPDGTEMTIHRRATLLSGSGQIVLGAGVPEAGTGSVLSFASSDVGSRYA